jgi:site-specific DNA-methyltransferase (adenine-specific)
MSDVCKIICGDCIEEMKKMADNSVDLILTDIPYGEVNRKSNGLRNLDKGVADIVNFDLNHLIKEFIRLSKGSIYVFCGTEQVSEIRKVLVENGLSTRLCIWKKTNPSPMNGQSIWLSGIECCVYGKKKNAVFNEHCKNSVWEFPTEKGKLHPTQKPIKLFEYLVKVSTNTNNIVLDPFCGSGTTGVACLKNRIKFIGIEKEEKYIPIINTRLKPYLEQQKLEGI